MKLALVTGGFRRLGAAIAARLASDGWTLALHCREASEPDHDLAAILALHQTRWQGFACDLSDGAAVSALLPRIVQHFGALPELIVNNASRFVADDFETLSHQELAVHMAVNLSAPVLLATGLAAQLAPDAILLPADFEAYRHYSRLFKAAARAIAPQMEDRGIDEIYLDLTALNPDGTADGARRVATGPADAQPPQR